MPTRSLLIRIPNSPLDWTDLCPDPSLARMAGSLIVAGQHTRIVDLGTVEVFNRLSGFCCDRRSSPGPDNSEMASRVNPVLSLVSAWRARGKKRLAGATHRAFFEEVARTLKRPDGLQFVVFKLDSPGNIEATLSVAKCLKAAYPDLTLVGAGPGVGRIHRRAPAEYDALDAMLLDGAESALGALAKVIGQRNRWSSVPGLVYQLNSTLIRSPQIATPSRAALAPDARYNSKVYPALHAAGKLRFFTIADFGDCDEPSSNGYQALSVRAVRRKAVSATVREMIDLHAGYGAQAFHVAGAGASNAQLRAFVRELRARRLPVSYSFSASIEHVDPTVLAGLKATGCYSIGFDLPTGSQRLLEDCYGRRFGVSQAERTLSAARAAGLYTVARLTYPCPWDDYHTQAETIRLLRRARPHSAPVSAFEGDWDSTACKEPPANGWGRVMCPSPLRPAPIMAQETEIAKLCGIDESVRAAIDGRRHDLRQEIAACRIEIRVSEDTALLAALSGFIGHEGKFCTILAQQLRFGDVAGVAAWVESLNATTCGRAWLDGVRGWDQIRTSVAN